MPTFYASRRNLLKTTLGTALVVATEPTWAVAPKKPKHKFTISLNTSTIMRQNLGLIKEIELAAAAGFKGIEIWIRTLEAYVKNGGNLSDVRKRANDLGIKIENAIGFSAWLSNDTNLRAGALEQTKREMDMLNQIGCNRLAAPPFGSTNDPIALDLTANRYKSLCDLGDQMAVQPQLEIWGFSKNIHLVGESLYIASESGHTKPAILADVYHLHRGGSQPNALDAINADQFQIFHMNDYPAEPSRELLTDGHRVMPGDGAAPIKKILQTLHKKNVPIVLSLELFSEKYWSMPAKEVLAIGHDKMLAAIENAIQA
jgi:2-keto-myo-inositol isomerase